MQCVTLGPLMVASAPCSHKMKPEKRPVECIWGYNFVFCMSEFECYSTKNWNRFAWSTATWQVIEKGSSFTIRHRISSLMITWLNDYISLCVYVCVCVKTVQLRSNPELETFGGHQEGIQIYRFILLCRFVCPLQMQSLHGNVSSPSFISQAFLPFFVFLLDLFSMRKNSQGAV